MSVLPIDENSALSVAGALHEFGIDELAKATVVSSDAWGHSLAVEDLDGAAYRLILNQYGYMSRLYREGFWDTPLYAS